MSFNIRVLYTGGTIGSVDAPLAPLSGQDFCAAFRSLVEPTILARYPGAVVSYDWLDPTLDSTNLQPGDWCTIAQRIVGAPGDSATYPGNDAFLVLHGTDTMAWTASALSLLLTGIGADGYADAILTKPVVVTGSQLPLFYRTTPTSPLAINYDTDALRNVLGAIWAMRAGLPASMLFFDDTLMLGNRTLKTDASLFDAFSTPDWPDLGVIGIESYLVSRMAPPAPYLSSLAIDNPTALASLQAQLAHVVTTIDNADVLVFPAFPAQYNSAAGTSALASMLKAALAADNGRVKGVFLEGYGEGNFPSGNPADAEAGAVYAVLKAAHDAGVVIVAGTQVIAGIVNSTAYASGSWLADAGAIGNYDMAGPATQAKLLILLALADYQGRAWSQSDIETLMRTPLAGEMTGSNRLDCRAPGLLLPGQSIAAFDGSATLVNDPDEGPVLSNASGTVLWKPLTGAALLPVRLIMQDDGNLVIYDRTNAPIWATQDHSVGQAYSVLILSGSATDGTLALYVYDYHNKRVTAELYGTAG
ncbi:asparaginase domain-containing protein [Stappia sp.]|uniref:asparaginase domain-containing protein n=1 Tax=Stappia sp. TaxID=1870903 RepID=UPI003A995C17